MRSDSAYSAPTYINRYGSWEDALEHFGFKPPSNETPEEVLCVELQRLTDELGHRPSMSEMDEHREFSSQTYTKRFGSWPDALSRCLE